MARTPLPESLTRSPRLSCGGKSIIDLIWDQLMEVYSELIDWAPIVTDPDHPDWLHQADAEDRGSLRGTALGLATALAIIINPYAPNINAIREEARQRHSDMEGKHASTQR